MMDEPGAVALQLEAPGFGELRGGHLGVRIAVTAAEIDAAQALRYRVFYQDMGARPNAAMAAKGRDFDAFDAVADHLLVVDHAIGPGPEGVVGTYRLIRSEAAASIGRFYSADEYDLTPVLNSAGQVMELGRSCVHPNYRNRNVMQMLWRGIAAYVFLHRIELMFGCASLPGTEPDAIADELTYLYYHHLAPPALRLRALPHRYIEMRRIDRDELNHKQALAKRLRWRTAIWAAEAWRRRCRHRRA